MPAYTIDMGTQDIVRIEVVFWAGRPYEKAPLVARATAALLKEGTRQRSGAILAEQLDFYGAGISAPFQLDTANLVLYSLNKHLPEVLPLFFEVIGQPAFPEEEVRAYCRRKAQSLQEDLSKNDVVAYREITEYIYGATHPYGYNSIPETYQLLQRDQLLDHHHRYFSANNAFVMLSGKVSTETEALVNQYLGQLPAGPKVAQPQLEVSDVPARKVRIRRSQATQSAIRMGRRLFDRSHPDAHGVFVLANLLGGYFGSRLMSNIREDKGYTYHIGASYDPLRFDGAIFIDTEVSPEQVNATLREIHLEMKRLREELVSDEELTMLRNYLMGTLLTMVDGPFNWGETVRTLLIEELPVTTLADLVQSVQGITAADLQQLAQTYLQPDDWWTVVVGEE